TFPMPPPATIYGHLCSTMGEWVDPRGLEFSYVFTHDSTMVDTDLEHCQILSVASTRSKFEYQGRQYKTNLEGTINPFKRNFFFRPRLTLYLNRPDWVDYFRHPRHPVVLGRSQDLATYTRVAIVELVKRTEVYFEHTLLPFRWSVHTGRGIVLTMPRFLDYENNREPLFDRFVALLGLDFTQNWMRYEQQPINHWVDPETPERQGVQRGLVFHQFLPSASVKESWQ
ncbi:MAG TPA: type I-B CRISPR-associated protein Cas5, partial [Blastocatellia bacterium]|nr:type I-B CRISPR-associated protein Cas5 [Blastocatellia bacterium]